MSGIYIPPHLRGKTIDSDDGQSNDYRNQSNDYRNQSNDYRNQSNDYGNRNYGNRNYGYGSRNFDNRNYGGGYDNRNYGGGYDNRNYGGYDRNYGGGNRGYGGGSRGYGGGYSRGPHKNSLGYHGDMKPSQYLLDKLFNKNESQTAGINFDKYDDIPVEGSAGCPEPYNEFTEETIGASLMNNLQLAKFSKPTPVQKYSIPIGLSGGDMMACAQTGSGKTAGFLFPVIAVMLKLGPKPEPENRPYKGTYISALILAPTRELAIQIFDEAQKFCYMTGIRPVVVYGGTPISNQTREIEQGCDIMVATPGRLDDLLERGLVRLDCIRFLVLDEADRMLDMGFEPQIRRIVENEGMPTDRQTFMFSATFPIEIQRLAGDFMKDYIFLTVGRVGAASKDVTQTVEWVEQHDKIDKILDFLDNAPEGLILIFVETKRGADQLEEILYKNNIPTSSIHGDKSQREREEALRSFKSGRTPILVATDVAARGLDIPNVTQVINMDLPSNIDDYVHRIGRTGRVGNVGRALSFFNEKNRNIYKELYELLYENQQNIPEFLDRMVNGSRRGSAPVRSNARGGARSGGNNSRNFGARDYRQSGSGGYNPNQGGYRNNNNTSRFNTYSGNEF